MAAKKKVQHEVTLSVTMILKKGEELPSEEDLKNRLAADDVHIVKEKIFELG